jgi:hypothetical protein
LSPFVALALFCLPALAQIQFSGQITSGIKSLAQLDDVRSILRLSYETLKGLISLASRGVAKLTLCATANGSFLKRHPGGSQPKADLGLLVILTVNTSTPMIEL